MTHPSSPIGSARGLFTDAGIPTGTRTATTYRRSHTRTEEGNTVATDTLTIIVSAIGIVLTLGASLFAAGAWMIRRIDDRIDSVESKIGTRIDAVAADVTDLKIAVARLEGPPRRLLVSGG